MSTEAEESDWEIFKTLKAQRKEENLLRLQSAPAVLTKAGVKWKSFNDGQHLVFKTESGKTVNFWPSTGKWLYGNRRGRDLQYLLAMLRRANEIAPNDS